MPVSKTFKKRPGTTDKGKDYEDLLVAKLILDSLMNNDIDDFHISSNNEAFGAFDDVTMEVEEQNQNKRKLTFQMKHVNKAKQFALKSLSEKTGNFSIRKYFESFKKCRKTMSGYKLVLITNLKLDLSGDTRIQLVDDELFHVKILKTTSSHCYKFQIVEDTTSCPFTEKMKEYEDFFEKFRLSTNENGVDQVKTDVRNKLLEEFGCDESIFFKYMAFINEWSRREGTKEMLNKRMMAEFLTLSLLSPSIHPYTIGDSVGEKAEILQKAIAKFTATVFDAALLKEVQRVWSDAKKKLKIMNIQEVNRTRRLYDPHCLYVDDLNKLRDEDCSKLMWYIGEEYPLIVEETPLTYKAISLCSHKKYVIIRREASSVSSDQYKIWEKLSDLCVHSEVFKELTAKFKCQLPGWEASLEDLIEENEKFLEIITTNELIKMIETKEEGKEELPEPYTNRFLSGNFFDLKYLEAVEEHTFIVLSNLQEEDTGKYSNRKNFRITKRCHLEDFEQICEEQKEMTFFYHFVMIDGRLQLIRNEGDISDLEKFRIESVEETAFYNPRYQNDVNIITCESGTGKSVFLRRLKNYLSPKTCNLILSSNDISVISAKFRAGGQQDQINDFILKLKCPDYDEFHKAIVTLLTLKGKICYLWDALDEISDENLTFIIDVILGLSRTGCVQWLTSGLHLRQRLEEKFRLLSMSIVPFDDQQQTCYIQIRLQEIGLESYDGILEKIKKNIAFAANRNILGIPQQIFMFTELFRQDKTKAARLIRDKLFSLSDLYRHFIAGKFDFFYNKIGVTILNRNLFEADEKNRIENYQRVALENLFDDEFLSHLNIGHHSMRKLQGGDQIGLTTTFGDKTQFVHISFAEYLAASYFAEHYREDLGLENIIFDRRYDNVRFFFDCLLAKDSLPHVAVLCKNLEWLKQHANNLGDCKDLAGRNLLHLAASWGKRCDLFPTRKSKNLVYDINAIFSNIEKSEQSDQEMLEYLLERCDVEEVDHMFRLDCLQYAHKLQCLLNVVIIEKREETGPGNSKNDIIFIYKLLAFSKYFEDDGIIDTYKNRFISLQIRSERLFRELLNYVWACRPEQVTRWPPRAYIEVEVDREGCRLLHYASRNGLFDFAQWLIKQGAIVEAVDKYGFTPLHYATENRHLEVAGLLTSSDQR